MMTSNVWHFFCIYHPKEQRCLLHFSIIMSHSLLSVTTVFGSKTKSTIPRLRPRPKLQDQDRGRSETSLVIRPWSQTPRPKTVRYRHAVIRITSSVKVQCALHYVCLSVGPSPLYLYRLLLTDNRKR